MADKLGLGPQMLKNFYRAYTLPPHVERAKADGNAERAASLEAELSRRMGAIKGAGKDAEFAEYVKAQTQKQAIWDAYAAAKGGESEAEHLEQVLASRAAFRETYHK